MYEFYLRFEGGRVLMHKKHETNNGVDNEDIEYTAVKN